MAVNVEGGAGGAEVNTAPTLSVLHPGNALRSEYPAEAAAIDEIVALERSARQP